jgi:hypothetical protein
MATGPKVGLYIAIYFSVGFAVIALLMGIFSSVWQNDQFSIGGALLVSFLFALPPWFVYGIYLVVRKANHALFKIEDK